MRELVLQGGILGRIASAVHDEHPVAIEPGHCPAVEVLQGNAPEEVLAIGQGDDAHLPERRLRARPRPRDQRGSQPLALRGNLAPSVLAGIGEEAYVFRIDLEPLRSGLCIRVGGGFRCVRLAMPERRQCGENDPLARHGPTPVPFRTCSASRWPTAQASAASRKRTGGRAQPSAAKASFTAGRAATRSK